jgi:hypothetical protein
MFIAVLNLNVYRWQEISTDRKNCTPEPANKFNFVILFCVAAVSVSVGVWTLVAISLERYFAICRPLKSRRWQTQFHAYKMIVVVWLASLIWNSPILVVSRLQAIKVTGNVASSRIFG